MLVDCWMQDEVGSFPPGKKIAVVFVMGMPDPVFYICLAPNKYTAFILFTTGMICPVPASELLAQVALAVARALSVL